MSLITNWQDLTTRYARERQRRETPVDLLVNKHQEQPLNDNDAGPLRELLAQEGGLLSNEPSTAKQTNPVDWQVDRSGNGIALSCPSITVIGLLPADSVDTPAQTADGTEQQSAENASAKASGAGINQPAQQHAPANTHESWRDAVTLTGPVIGPVIAPGGPANIGPPALEATPHLSHGTHQIDSQSDGQQAKNTWENLKSSSAGLNGAVMNLVDASSRVLCSEALASGSGTGLAEPIGEYRQFVESLGLLAGERGLFGFHDCCLLFCERLVALVNENRAISEAEIELLASWPVLAVEYATLPDDGDALVAHLLDAVWGTPMATGEVAVLRSLLNSTAVTNTEASFDHETETQMTSKCMFG